MFFETNDLFNTLNTLGLDMSSLIDIKNLNSHKNEKFVCKEEGFMRGNLYKDEYKGYKHYKIYPVIATTEKEKKLLNIYELEFAIMDLSFHLDLHEDDKESFELFKHYNEILLLARKEYSEKYGPLAINETSKEVYNWVDNPWPWNEDKGDMYV